MIANIIIISLFCNGIYLLTRKNMLLGFIRDWYIAKCEGIENGKGDISWARNYDSELLHPVKIFFYKPLFGCLPCMASLWGTIGYLLIGDFMWNIYIVTIVSCVCVNLIISKIYE